MHRSRMSRWPLGCTTAALAIVYFSSLADAYTSAGDRTFPATILVPEAAPVDDLFLTTASQPLPDGRQTSINGVFDKTLTERLGIGIEDGYNWRGRTGASTLSGWQNLKATIRYLAILDPQREFLLSLGAAREFGGTGAQRIGAHPQGATTPMLYFGRGLGDLDLSYLRPLALTGTLGYQISDARRRPDGLVTAFAAEYSIPYLESKVQAFALPDVIRAMTPLVEFFVTTPTRNSRGNPTSAVIAPGINYSGQGWEFVIEAQLPATRAAGTGVGVAAELHLSLDYLFPGSIGKPLFSVP